jgi:hypothetical protein
VHDFDGVVCILFAFELDKAVALVFVGYLIAGDVDIDDRSTLGE